MFTIDIILGALKKIFGSALSFLWEYKGWILLGVIIGALYIRGNNYKEDYQNEAVAHVKTVLEYDQQINDIRLAGESALRIAQEKSATDYKELVEKTSLIQKEYTDREKDINATINKLNSSNNSLQQQIKTYTSNSNTSGSGEKDSSYAPSLQLTGELLTECVERKQYYAEQASKLSNSVITLQDWGNAVINQNKGEKNE